MPDQPHPPAAQPQPLAAGGCGDGRFDLPDLHHAQLDWDALDCVLADLDDFTSLVELRGRDLNGDVTALKDLVDARDRLVAGTLGGLRIIYRFADQTWSDTLVREPSGARLSRMISPALFGD